MVVVSEKATSSRGEDEKGTHRSSNCSGGDGFNRHPDRRIIIQWNFPIHHCRNHRIRGTTDSEADSHHWHPLKQIRKQVRHAGFFLFIKQKTRVCLAFYRFLYVFVLEGRVELPTLCSSGKCSNQLSYSSVVAHYFITQNNFLHPISNYPKI